MSLFKSAFTVGSFTLMSRILGYVRDILIASMIGATYLADSFFVAFRLPNIFRQLSAEGAFNNAFVPLFSGKLTAEGKQKAINFAKHIFSFMVTVLIIFTVLIEILMPLVMYILAPGFIDDPQKYEVTVYFARITFPYLIFISIISLYSGMLNSVGKFAAAAATPVLLNICLISCLLFLSEYFDTPAHGLVWAVTVGGLIQLAWIVLVAKRQGIVLTFNIPRLDRDVKTLLKRMLPGIIGGGVTQINLWINTVIATLIPGAVSFLYYADRLVQFPLALIGTAMGTAILPLLSKYVKENNQRKVIELQNKGLEIVLLFTLPAAVGVAVISEPLISLMFERGKFGSYETLMTAKAVLAYSFGLPAFVLIKIFAPGFFARGDTKTPVKIAFICMFINIAISLSLISYIGHVALAIATSVSSWINSILLCAILIKTKRYKFGEQTSRRIFKICLCSLLMGLIVHFGYNIVPETHLTDFFNKLLVVSVLIIGAMAIYMASIFATKCYSVFELKQLLTK